MAASRHCPAQIWPHSWGSSRIGTIARFRSRNTFGKTMSNHICMKPSTTGSTSHLRLTSGLATDNADTTDGTSSGAHRKSDHPTHLACAGRKCCCEGPRRFSSVDPAKEGPWPAGQFRGLLRVEDMPVFEVLRNASPGAADVHGLRLFVRLEARRLLHGASKRNGRGLPVQRIHVWPIRGCGGSSVVRVSVRFRGHVEAGDGLIGAAKDQSRAKATTVGPGSRKRSAASLTMAAGALSNTADRCCTE